MSMIPKNILAAGCAAYHTALMTGPATFGEGIEAAYFAIHDHDDWVSAGPREWTGEGLPPVGTVCERNSGSGEWVSTKILAHSHLGSVAAYEDVFSPYHLGWCKRESDFRPVRTAEQIEAEERNNGIDAILDAYTYTVGPCTHKLTHSQAMRLYDAGVRKVTP